MPLMKSPYVPKPVQISEENVSRLRAAGFAEVEEPKAPKATPKRRSTKAADAAKSE